MNSPTSTSDAIYPGLRVPTLETIATMEDLVRWAAAADDYTTFHFDPAAAHARGFDGPVVHGTYQASLIARMLTRWLGSNGWLTDLNCRYHQPVIVGNPLLCHAEVTSVKVDAGEQIVALKVWTESPAGKVATTGTATAQRPVDDQGPVSLVNDELLEAFRIGEVIGRYTFKVTTERIRRYAGVLHDTDLETMVTHRKEPKGDRRVAPTTFFATLDPLELKIMSHNHGLDRIPYQPIGGGNAFNEIEYERPIRAGDVITVEVVYTDVYQKSGRNGPLLFRVRENILTDGAGDRVAVARSGHVYAFDVSGYEPPERSRRQSGAAEEDKTGEELPSLVRIPTTATLVRYSAAADDYAPLHYDHTYARARGYDGVIVHGFLKAGYMATMLEDWGGPDAFVKRFRAEYRGPDYPDRKIICRGRVIRSFKTDGKRAAEVALWTERTDGSVSTRGSATVVFAD